MMNKVMPKIALGTWSWGVGMAGSDQVFGNRLDEKDLAPVFDAAMKNGLNLWDSAVVYGMGASEAILGTFTQKYPREDVIISTKFTPQIAGNKADPMAAMPAPLVKSGKVKRVSVSNHNLAQIKRAEEILSAEGIHISAVQNHYSLLYRSSEDAGILDCCKEHGITFFAYMVLEQGAISSKYNTKNLLPAGSQRGETYNPLMPQIEKLTDVTKKIADAHGVGAAQIPVAWAIAKGTTPIIGVTSPKQVEDAVKAANIVLTADEMAEIEKVANETGVDTRGNRENPMA